MTPMRLIGWSLAAIVTCLALGLLLAVLDVGYEVLRGVAGG